MKRNSIIYIVLSAILFCGGYELNADAAGDLVREGNRLYHEKKFNDAEVSYRKALELSPTPLTSFNLGDALYKQGKFEEAEKIFQTLSDQGADKTDLADAYHNLGNSYLQSKKYKEGLEAFKKSVLNNPADPDAKYNYEYARRLLQQQQEQQKKDDKNKDDKNKDQDKKDDQKQDQDKKDQDKKDDQQKQDQEKKDDEKKDGEKKDQQQQDQGKEEKDKQEKGQKPQEQKISKEDAERMLKALQKKEQKLQKKLKKKQKSVKTKIEKKW